MDNERALTILNDAYNTLESLENFQVREIDPFEEDAMVRWQRLRAQSREPEPQPRQRKLDTARDAAQARWDQWCDARIEAALISYDVVVGRAIGQNCERVSREIRRLQKALDDARLEIKRLKAAVKKADDDNRIVNWSIDRKAYTAAPISAAEKPMATFDVRQLFEQYHGETFSND
jgi:hypothetical protein